MSDEERRLLLSMAEVVEALGTYFAMSAPPTVAKFKLCKPLGHLAALIEICREQELKRAASGSRHRV